MFRKRFMTVVVVIAALACNAATVYAKNIPDYYSAFIGSKTHKNWGFEFNSENVIHLPKGDTYKMPEKMPDGSVIRFYYVSDGNNMMRLSDPNGEVITEKELKDFFANKPKGNGNTTVAVTASAEPEAKAKESADKTKNIPASYQVFVQQGSGLFHSLTVYINYDVKVGEIVKQARKTINIGTFDAYYVSIGNRVLKLATPDGQILTTKELDEFFSGEKAADYEPMEWENEVIRLVNAERKKAGALPLEANSLLMEIASLKAEEMAELNYFSHTSPIHGSPSEFAKYYGYSKSVGENAHLGMENQSPEHVVNSWLNSEGHKKNMLNPNFKYIGVGYNTKYYVQLFSK